MNIFISYRRDDSQHITGRIYDRLIESYKKDQIFKDVDSIPVGVDFREYIGGKVSSCDVVLVIIGENWINAKDEQGNYRLRNENDFVRIEIETALTKGKIVIPVLLNQVQMPSEKELPSSISNLAYKNGGRIRPDPDFNSDINRLIRQLKLQRKIFTPSAYRFLYFALGLLGFFVVIWMTIKPFNGDDNQDQENNKTTQPAKNSDIRRSENPLLERIRRLSSLKFQIKEHILFYLDGKPVSAVATANFSDSLVEQKIIVFHFTATTSPEATVKWLADSRANASAHVVIDKDGNVTQLLPFDFKAFHAGRGEWKGYQSLNSYSIGIELVNAGRLERKDGKWVAWNGVAYPDAEVYISHNKETGEETGWHKYSSLQIEAAKAVVTALVHNYPSIVDVIGHEDIAPGRKLDPGPAFPMSEMKSLLNHDFVKPNN